MPALQGTDGFEVEAELAAVVGFDEQRRLCLARAMSASRPRAEQLLPRGYWCAGVTRAAATSPGSVDGPPRLPGAGDGRGARPGTGCTGKRGPHGGGERRRRP